MLRILFHQQENIWNESNDSEAELKLNKIFYITNIGCGNDKNKTKYARDFIDIATF